MRPFCFITALAFFEHVIVLYSFQKDLCPIGAGSRPVGMKLYQFPFVAARQLRKAAVPATLASCFGLEMLFRFGALAVGLSLQIGIRAGDAARLKIGADFFQHRIGTFTRQARLDHGGDIIVDDGVMKIHPRRGPLAQPGIAPGPDAEKSFGIVRPFGFITALALYEHVESSPSASIRTYVRLAEDQDLFG